MAKKTAEPTSASQSDSAPNPVATIGQLVPGKVEADHLRLLIKLQGISGEKIIAALHLHFVEGRSQADVLAAQGEDGVAQALLSRKVVHVRKLHEQLVELAQYYQFLPVERARIKEELRVEFEQRVRDAFV